MPLALWLVAAILGVVEGLTEFLPVSSTGHLIVAGSLLGFTGEEAKRFEIVIQAGAIFAVCWEYRKKLFEVAKGLPTEPRARRFAANLIIAFIPAAALGFVFGHAIKRHLFAPVPVAAAFVLGAFVIQWVEWRARRNPALVRIESVDDLGFGDALKLGIAQAFALIPGTSRSGATIIGGMLFGLSRKAATEFSFFLAIPTLFAATGYELLKARHEFRGADLPLFGVGFVTAFVSAFFVVRALLRYVANHDFLAFAWYRILFGVVILGTAFLGWVHWE